MWQEYEVVFGRTAVRLQAWNRHLQSILKAASPRAMDYEDIALRLGEIPWEVLWACHVLVRAKVASRRTDAEFCVAKP
ncbi:hypothetical protein GCM10007320_54130 [Pseudorhodoferax aquiterrae]|uniref:Uncharacterized protein n=1 Tax=Pseudorhodoferax aquiterrae TaxID=747304 RepID=A0ABQ3G9E4_9BURK|nr:hypothetical protein [Pseudorhodoferax aquiterrae]GHC98435.1 hypothetical protein GCM10007320_54130 [Pseudorhodoferax aquiterrae]